jgi:hypothetical protein
MQHAANDDTAEISQRVSHLMFRLPKRRGQAEKESLRRYLSCHVVVVWTGQESLWNLNYCPRVSETEERISGLDWTGRDAHWEGRQSRFEVLYPEQSCAAIKLTFYALR